MSNLLFKGSLRPGDLVFLTFSRKFLVVAVKDPAMVTDMDSWGAHQWCVVLADDRMTRRPIYADEVVCMWRPQGART